MSLVDLFNRMTDAEIVAVHMTSNNEHHCNRHVVMGDVSHPETAGDRIQPTFEGEEVAVGSPVAGEEGSDPCTDTGIKLSQQVLVEEFVGQGDISRRCDGLAIQNQRLAGINGIHQLGDGR